MADHLARHLRYRRFTGIEGEPKADHLVRLLHNQAFTGVEAGSEGSLPWRTWRNGRIIRWTATNPDHSSTSGSVEELKRCVAEIVRRQGWAT